MNQPVLLILRISGLAVRSRCVLAGDLPCSARRGNTLLREHFNEKFARMCVIAEQRLAKDTSSTQASSPLDTIVKLGAKDLQQVDWGPSRCGWIAGSMRLKGLLGK